MEQHQSKGSNYINRYITSIRTYKGNNRNTLKKLTSMKLLKS